MWILGSKKETMAKNPTNPWPTGPRTVFFDDSATAPTRSKATREGRIRRIATGVWTADMASPVPEIIEKNVIKIIARRIGPSILVDRTAARAGRVDNGVIAIATDSRTTDLKLPGVTIRVRPLVTHASDIAYPQGMQLATPARALVDNLDGPANADRYLTTGELQDWLALKKLEYTNLQFGRLQTDAHQVAVDLDVDVAARIDELFAIANQEHGAPAPVGILARAAAAGDLYDEHRLSLFSELRKQLANIEQRQLPEPDPDGELPFYEAYFSNYIEGTEFHVEQARRIVEHSEMPSDRPADAHDILYTFHCVTDHVGRAASSTDAAKLREILTKRHRTFTAGRPDMTPGVFKTEPNRVAAVDFVKPEKVEATLTRALSHLSDVPVGFARAVYMMVVIAEVHPFVDGNGRSARLMMNAELSAAQLCRIVIPTVCRNEYMSSLRKFSHSGSIDAVLKVLDLCWRWTHTVPWSAAEAAELYLQSTNAYVDSNEAERAGLRLLIH